MATIKEIKRKRRGSAFQVAFFFKGRRRWLSLGSNYSRRDALEIASKVESIVSALTVGREIDVRVENWLALIPDDLRRRLERVELVERVQTPTLRELCDEYLDVEGRSFKPKTLAAKKSIFAKVFSYLDPETLASEVSKKDALDLTVRMTERGVCEATRGAVVRDLRRLYNWAIELDVLKENPFKAAKRCSFQNKDREVYVSLDDYRRLLDACPNQQWRVLLALYRIGGLRSGEALLVRWRDVDFARGRLLVHSPKTERHAGKDCRVVPLFPELRAELEKLWYLTPERSPELVVDLKVVNKRRQLEQIVFQAGLTQWTRLVQNLRSSRAIEIEREFGSLAESEWLGHSPKTAREHYLHVLDSDYERAAKTTTKTTADVEELQGQPSF